MGLLPGNIVNKEYPQKYKTTVLSLYLCRGIQFHIFHNKNIHIPFLLFYLLVEHVSLFLINRHFSLKQKPVAYFKSYSNIKFNKQAFFRYQEGSANTIHWQQYNDKYCLIIMELWKKRKSSSTIFRFYSYNL